MGVPNARKTDGSELQNTLEGMEHYGTQKQGQKVPNEVRKRERCGTYIVGVKDLASAYALCPRLSEYGGLSIYGRTEFYGAMKGL